MSSKTLTGSMQVKIYAPFKTYFDDQAQSVSATNDTGPFDILPAHKNFVCLLKPGEIRVRVANKQDFSIPVSQAVMHVKSDKVTVFLNV